MLFRDRKDAGEQLAVELGRYRDQNPIVLGLPRGGVPVAFEVARALGVGLEVLVVRKVGVPFQRELGMGAVAEGGEVFLSRPIINVLGISESEVAEAVEREQAEVAARVQRFRGGRPAPVLRDRTVIVVDDGIATGGTVRAALAAIRKAGARRLVLAVPVAAPETVEELRPQVDDLVCLYAPRYFQAIGLWYEDFRQVADEQVAALLAQAEPRPPSASPVVDCAQSSAWPTRR